MGIAKIHLINGNKVDLDGYKWFGNNRKIFTYVTNRFQGSWLLYKERVTKLF